MGTDDGPRAEGRDSAAALDALDALGAVVGALVPGTETGADLAFLEGSPCGVAADATLLLGNMVE